MKKSDTTINIETYKKTSTEVWRFVNTLPPVLSRCLFQRIVDEAYDMAGCYPIEIMKEQLITSICNNFNRSANKLALEYLSAYLQIDIRVDNLKEILTTMKWEYLPPKNLLVQAYECFYPGRFPYQNCDMERWSRLAKTIKSDGIQILESDILLDTGNCFYKLGYQVSYLNNDENKDNLILHWYGMGEILDNVFDCIWGNANSQIARSLFKILMETCSKNEFFKNIVEKRYNEIRKFKPSWPLVEFKYYNTIEEAKVKGLDILHHNNDNDSESIFQNLLHLCRKLQEMKYLPDDLDFSLFYDVFTDRMITPILWIGNTYSLSAFIDYLFIEYIQVRGEIGVEEFFELSHKCFKDKKNVDGRTLSQYRNRDITKQYKDEFDKMFESFHL